MTTFTFWMAIAVVIATIYGLIKRWETRLVLIAAGLLMAVLSLDPLTAFVQFDKSMTNSSLIIAICSAMGFAAVVSLTKCDVHLVALLTRPLGRLGVFLLPASMCVTGLCSVAIPSTAGLCASVGPTLIPLLIRAGFRPAIAAAAVVAGTTPALFNPGVAHNVFVAKLAEIGVMDLIGLFATKIFLFSLAIVIGLTVVCLIYRDYSKNRPAEEAVNDVASNLPKHVNLAYAFAPLLPVVILIGFTLWSDVKISVATAMLTGAIYAMAVTRSDPAEVTKKFFDGMGSGYAKILGIIIAAGVFAAGLRAAGVIDLMISALTQANEWARVGGCFGPYFMGYEPRRRIRHDHSLARLPRHDRGLLRAPEFPAVRRSDPRRRHRPRQPDRHRQAHLPRDGRLRDRCVLLHLTLSTLNQGMQSCFRKLFSPQP